MPLCLCGAAFVRPKFLHPFKNSVLYNRFMGIEKDSLLFLCGWNPLFQFVGFGIAFEVYRMPAVVHALQNADNGTISPVIRAVGECFPLFLCVIRFCYQHIIRFEDFCYLRRSFPTDT